MSTVAEAAPHWTFDFDPSHAAKPTDVSNQINSGNSSYPEMPVARLTTLVSDDVTLYFWPQTADLLERMHAAVSTPPMVWPLTSTTCTAHAGFATAQLDALATTTTSDCTAADARLRTDLADVGACNDVEFPELYVLTYSPSNARANTDTIVHMIGSAGEALTHAGPPPEGLLPDDFIPTLRTVLQKLRHDDLATHLSSAKTKYTAALGELTAHAACFDTTAAQALTTRLTAMNTELDAQTTLLANQQSTGTAASAQEATCLAARARTRPTLPFPSLTRAEREWIAYWLGGIYWRMRGGGLIPLGSTQDARQYFTSNAMTQIGKMLGGDDGGSIAFDLYLPLVLQGWGDWMDMGTTPGGDDKYYDLVKMSARGEYQVHGAAAKLAGKGYDTLDFTTGGIMMGAGYYRGLYPDGDFRWGAQLQPAGTYSDLFSLFTCIGEMTFGADMSLGLAHTLLNGTPTNAAPVDVCAGMQCGDDGCGGSCGTCGDGLTCSAGQCVGGSGDDDGSNGNGSNGENGDDDGTGTNGTKSGGCSTSGGGVGGLAIVLACVLPRRRRR
jgi:hypothetical protein